jgi:hypothetical protein
VSLDLAAAVVRLVVCALPVAADLADAEGLIGVGFLPSQEKPPELCDGRLAFFAALGAPDKDGPLVADDAGRALVADDSVLMLGPRVTRPDWFALVVLPGGTSSMTRAPGGKPSGPNSCWINPPW